MAKLDKGTLALTFKFDCDRFLRFRLASDAERDSLGVSAETYKRPGIELIKAAGRRWEADKYQDLIDTSDDGKVVFLLEDKVDDLLCCSTYIFRLIRSVSELTLRTFLHLQECLLASTWVGSESHVMCIPFNINITHSCIGSACSVLVIIIYNKVYKWHKYR